MAQLAVAANAEPRETGMLPRVGLGDARPDCGRGLSARGGAQERDGDDRHLDVEINTIQQGAGNGVELVGGTDK